MADRLLLAVLFITCAIAAWALLNRLTIRRLAKEMPGDPLLANVPDGMPVIVYFTTPFCEPCRTQQRPALQKVQTERPVHVIQIDASEQPDIAERWGVFSAPTTFILDDRHIPRHVNRGVASAETIKKQLEV